MYIIPSALDWTYDYPNTILWFIKALVEGNNFSDCGDGTNMDHRSSGDRS